MVKIIMEINMEPVYIPQADEDVSKPGAAAPASPPDGSAKPAANSLREFSRFVHAFMGSAVGLAVVAPLCDAMVESGASPDWVGFCAFSLSMIGAFAADKLGKKLASEGKLPAFMYRGGKKFG